MIYAHQEVEKLHETDSAFKFDAPSVADQLTHQDKERLEEIAKTLDAVGTGPLCEGAKDDAAYVRNLSKRLLSGEGQGELEAAARDLLALKDGPRDERYRQEKPRAWDRLRAALLSGEDGRQRLIVELAQARDRELAKADSFSIREGRMFLRGRASGLRIAIELVQAMPLLSEDVGEEGDLAGKRERAVDQLLEIAKLAHDDVMRAELEGLASRLSLPPTGQPDPTQQPDQETEGDVPRWTLWRAKLDPPDAWNLFTAFDRPHPGQEVEYVQVVPAASSACEDQEKPGIEIDAAELEEPSDPTEGLPPELAEALLDPTIVVRRDHDCRQVDGRTLAEHLEEWRNAPSNTVSADPLPADQDGEDGWPEVRIGRMRRKEYRVPPELFLPDDDDLGDERIATRRYIPDPGGEKR